MDPWTKTVHDKFQVNQTNTWPCTGDLVFFSQYSATKWSIDAIFLGVTTKWAHTWLCEVWWVYLFAFKSYCNLSESGSALLTRLDVVLRAWITDQNSLNNFWSGESLDDVCEISCDLDKRSRRSSKKFFFRKFKMAENFYRRKWNRRYTFFKSWAKDSMDIRHLSVHQRFFELWACTCF